jgi:hypothetical protein
MGSISRRREMPRGQWQFGVKKDKERQGRVRKRVVKERRVTESDRFGNWSSDYLSPMEAVVACLG